VRPVRLGWASFPIPFRTAFAHASATRRAAENLIVRVEDAEGRVGLGEGCPRVYVTGETVASAAAFVERHRGALMAIDGVPALRAWLAEAKEDIDLAPSAACAVELALLDLFARQSGVPVEDLLGSPRLAAPLKVTAVYGATPAPVFWLQRRRFAGAGMVEAKLKLTGDPRRDGRRAARLAHRGRVRLDANNLWPDAEAALAGLAAASRHAWAVEEPVGPRDWLAIARVGRESGMAVILDESFSGAADLEALEPGPRYLANVRLSHLGGLLRTLDAMCAAADLGLELIVGAHVGETSLLARAGIAAAAAAGPRLAGYEGAYGAHLLLRDPAAPSLTFGRDGRVAPGLTFDPAAPGWGLRWTGPGSWKEQL
jgi:L-alanine-DL-glutamate epimerase-like enolase superfamily enzyme